MSTLLMDIFPGIKLVTELKIARLGLGFLCGWALALSGCIYQSALQNRLAEPSLLGVSAGAALASLLSIYFINDFMLLPWWFSVYGICGGASIAVLVLFCQHFFHLSNEALLLLGIALAAVVAAVINFMLFFADAWQMQEYLHWTYGSFGFASLQDLLILLPITLLATCLVVRRSRELQLLSLGAQEAHYLGLAYYRWQIYFLGMATVLASVTVALAGILPFIALLIPNAVRLIVKDFKLYLLISSLLGAISLSMLDFVSLHLPGELQIPVGLILSLLGLPFLITELLLQQRRKYYA